MTRIGTRCTVVVLSMLLLAAGRAGATAYTWTGGGSDGKWTNAANWGGGGYPNGAADSALINSGSGIITNATALVLGELTVDTGFTGTNILGGDLSVTTSGGGSGNLIINAGMLLSGKDITSGIAVDGAFTIGSNGTVVVRRKNTTGQGAGQSFTAASLTVDGRLKADGEGFGPSAGPGVGDWYDGGSHGGRGGDYNNNSAGPTYGSFVNPTALGSGGGPGGTDGAGGGALLLTVSGGVTVNGTMSANGGNGADNGGSGGSVNIAAATLAGTGAIRANGGTGSTSFSCGGGGRVAFAISGSDTFSGVIEAKGGETTAVKRGLGGTIYLSQQKRSNLTLGGAGNMTTLRLGSDNTMGPGMATNYLFGAITIETNGILEIDGNPYTNIVNGKTYGNTAVLQVESLEVKANGLLSAEGLGFFSGLGPSVPNYLDGGSHGGRGGLYTAPSATYGSLTNPVTMGAGGGSGYRGGGALLIVASGTVTVNGTVSANGLANANSGGAGGSINIKAPVLTGAGTIRANGGTASLYGCGAGGRIAFSISGSDAFSGAIEANGGGTPTNNCMYRGSAGTLWLSQQRRDTLTLGGSGNLKSLRLGMDDTMGPNGATNYVFGSLTIETNGLLEVDGNPSVNVVNGKTNGFSLVLNAGTLEIKAGGRLSADGLGFGRGPGAATGHVDGGSHGGRGGVWAGIGPTYGSVTNPTALGSGGSGGGSSGGGGIMITTTNSLTVNGTISANGLGRGSGGSVNIFARSLTGNGSILANGGVFTADTFGNGGGGRVAMRLTVGTDFGDVTNAAIGGTNGVKGAAGTIYLQHAGQASGAGVVWIASPHATSATNTITELPSRREPGVYASELIAATLIVTNKAALMLTTNMTVGDLYLKGTSITNLYLNGWTLTVNSLYHPDWGTTNWVRYAGGTIVWKLKRGTVLSIY